MELQDGTRKREIIRYRTTYVWGISQIDNLDPGEHAAVQAVVANAETKPVPVGDRAKQVEGMEVLVVLGLMSWVAVYPPAAGDHRRGS